MWHITPEIRDEWQKKQTQRNSEQMPVTIGKKMKFGNGEQDIITYQTSRATQITIVCS